MILLNNVSKIYTNGHNSNVILENISIRIEKNDYVAIIGESGSGKSTLLNILGGFDSYEGCYYFNNVLINDCSHKQVAQIRNKNIGFVFQSFNLIPNMSVFKNVELPLLYSKDISYKDRSKMVKMAVNKVGMVDKLYELPCNLSGGQQQRIAIARALVNSPYLILADEPTGNLDKKTKREIMDLFIELNKSGVTIIMVTHDLEQTIDCNRVFVCEDRRIRERNSVF